MAAVGGTAAAHGDEGWTLPLTPPRRHNRQLRGNFPLGLPIKRLHLPAAAARSSLGERAGPGGALPAAAPQPPLGPAPAPAPGTAAVRQPRRWFVKAPPGCGGAAAGAGERPPGRAGREGMRPAAAAAPPSPLTGGRLILIGLRVICSGWVLAFFDRGLKE